eukprot:687285-Amorphochlora_amoeboformis.AAC.1
MKTDIEHRERERGRDVPLEPVGQTTRTFPRGECDYGDRLLLQDAESRFKGICSFDIHITDSNIHQFLRK